MSEKLAWHLILEMVNDILVAKIPEGKNKPYSVNGKFYIREGANTWNGTWTDIDALRDLQIPTYLIAQNNSRVVGINMFAYMRKDQGPL